MASPPHQVRHRWPKLAQSATPPRHNPATPIVALTALFAYKMREVRLDSDLNSMLPVEHSARVDLKRMEALFGGTDMVMVIVTADDVLERATLKQIQQLSRKIAWVKNVKRVLSMFTLKELRIDEGQIMAAAAVKRLPRTPRKREALRERLRRNEFVHGTVVSTDFKAALIIGVLRPGARDGEVLAGIQEVINKNPGPGTVQLAGMPLVRTSVAKDLRRDIINFAAIGLPLVLLVLFLFFRQVRVALPPFLLMLAACVAALGALPLLGWKVQVITLIVPLFGLAVCNALGVHLLVHHQDLRRGEEHLDPGQMARALILRLGWPLLWTGLTLIATLLCLGLHQLIPARQLGILAAVGVLFALAGGLLFIPALVAVLPGRAASRGAGSTVSKAPRVERLLGAWAGAAARRPGRVAILALGAVLLAVPGVYLLERETNPILYYDSQTQVARTSKIIAEKFGGFAPISVIAEGDIKSPEVLGKLDALERHLQRDPLVGQTLSLARVVRKLNHLTHENDAAADSIPATRAEISELIMVYSMSGNPEDFDRLVDFPYRHAQLTARITSLKSADMDRVVRDVREYLAQHGGGVFSLVGGVGVLFADLSHLIQRGLLISLAAALALLFLLALVFTRDLRIGAMLLGAVAMALTLLHGIMGYLGHTLNIASVLLSVFIIGAVMDSAITLIWRCRLERGRLPDLKQAVVSAVKTSGRGILGNAVAVSCGFAVALSSSFTIVRSFGLMVMVSLLLSAVMALLVLPALCLLLRPGYIEGHVRDLIDEASDETEPSL